MEEGYALGKDIQKILNRLERLEALAAAKGRSTVQGRAAEEGGAGLEALVAAKGRSTGPTNLCTLKVLPQTHWVAAAARAVAINPVNAPATHMLRAAALDVVIPPEHLALLTQKYWGAGGVHLTVGFFGAPPAALQARILSHMNAWSQWANVQFVLTTTNPQVRIALTPAPWPGMDGGYWSYHGTDILSIAANEPTMMLDGFNMAMPNSEFVRVVRHETGHTLGFPHEHARAEIVNRIDRNKAIAFFGGPPNNWPPQKVIDQVLTPLNNSALIATAQADINSIMCYWLPASIMSDGIAVTGGTDIDSQDGAFAASVYPNHGVGTLAFIKTANTPNGRVEVHLSSGSSGYQTRILETATTFGNETDGVWQLLPNLDLAFIKTSNTPNGHVEVHIASRASNYQTRILETATTFANESDGVWQLLQNQDLVFIKTINTPNGHVEVHIASRASNYQTRIIETATTFANESDGVWQLLPNLDLAFIKTSNTPNGHVEVHIASRASNYQTRILETATTFANESDGVWLLLSNLDLVFIKTSNTPSGHVEVHIASRASNYQTRTVELSTTFVNENDGTWSLLLP